MRLMCGLPHNALPIQDILKCLHFRYSSAEKCGSTGITNIRTSGSSIMWAQLMYGESSAEMCEGWKCTIGSLLRSFPASLDIAEICQSCFYLQYRQILLYTVLKWINFFWDTEEWQCQGITKGHILL